MDLLDDRIRDWVGQQKAKLEPSAATASPNSGGPLTSGWGSEFRLKDNPHDAIYVSEMTG